MNHEKVRPCTLVERRGSVERVHVLSLGKRATASKSVLTALRREYLWEGLDACFSPWKDNLRRVSDKRFGDLFIPLWSWFVDRKSLRLALRKLVLL